MLLFLWLLPAQASTGSIRIASVSPDNEPLIGFVYGVYDEDGRELAKLDNNHDTLHLEDGTYVIKELDRPDGYQAAEPFTIKLPYKNPDGTWSRKLTVYPKHFLVVPEETTSEEPRGTTTSEEPGETTTEEPRETTTSERPKETMTGVSTTEVPNETTTVAKPKKPSRKESLPKRLLNSGFESMAPLAGGMVLVGLVGLLARRKGDRE